MKILDMIPFLIIIPFILSVILVIIGMSSKKKTLKKVCTLLGFIIPIICIFVLFAIIIPYSFLTLMFKGYNGIIGIITVIFTIWLVISLIIKFKNRIILLKNNEKEIYIRDIEVNYSPAVVSYLMNNRIETKKDLSATLLNLCAKNILKIEKDENQKVNIIDLDNKREIEKLPEDEKYAYEMFKTKITSSKISKWRDKVKEEYDKYKFSKENNINLYSCLSYLYIILILAGFILAYFNMNGKIWAYAMVILFFSIWELAIFYPIRAFTKSSEFIDTYTKKGAIEYNRWKKFEKFMIDYTMIEEKEYENIVILGEYLAYSTALGINKKCDKELYDRLNKEFDFDFFAYVDEINMKES